MLYNLCHINKTPLTVFQSCIDHDECIHMHVGGLW